MPDRDGSGPRTWSGGSKKGRDSGRRGPPGLCVCLNCGERVEHKPGLPCRERRCPECGYRMRKE